MRPARLRRRTDFGDRGAEIAQQELRTHADDAKACAPQLQIAARIRAEPARVNYTIHFNDEPDAGRTEVSDELAGNQGSTP